MGGMRRGWQSCPSDGDGEMLRASAQLSVYVVTCGIVPIDFS
jgi:hypothetical protein